LTLSSGEQQVTNFPNRVSIFDKIHNCFAKKTAELSDEELAEAARVLVSMPWTQSVEYRLSAVRREQHSRKELDAGFVPQVVRAAQ
jgi:hypothetical protein